MSPDLILYIPIFLLLAVVLVLLATVISHLNLTRKYISLRDQEAKINEPFVEDAQKIFLKAQKDAENTLSEAQKSAGKIVSSAEYFTQEEKAVITSELAKLSEANVANFHNMIKDTKAEALKVFQNTSQQLSTASNESAKMMQEETTRQIGNLQSKLTSQIDLFNKSLLNLLSDEQKKVEEDLNAYKKAKFDQLERRIIAVSKKVAKEAIGKSISIEDQSDFVVRSLEDAKKHKLFG